MNKLKVMSTNFVIQTTKILRLATRKSKWLISEQAWEDERNFYVDSLNVYISDFSRDYIMEEVKKAEKGELIESIMEWIKSEMHTIKAQLNEQPKEEMIIRLEILLSLTYALQLSLFEKGQLHLHAYLLTEKEMTWYLEEYIEEKNMMKEFFILTCKGEKIA